MGGGVLKVKLRSCGIASDCSGLLFNQGGCASGVFVSTSKGGDVGGRSPGFIVMGVKGISMCKGDGKLSDNAMVLLHMQLRQAEHLGLLRVAMSPRNGGLSDSRLGFVSGGNLLLWSGFRVVGVVSVWVFLASNSVSAV